MKKITLKAIRSHFKENGYEPRHSFHGIKHAINRLNEEVEWCAFDIFLLIIENQPIHELNTHSYGFHTATGRHLIDTFQEYYYEFINEQS